MKTLVLGGIKSGKSRLAESIATDTQLPVLYIATARAGDREMQRRIEHHRSNRPTDWQVLEEPVELARVIRAEANNNRCVLVDCLTLWLTNLLMLEDEDILQKQTRELTDAVAEASGSVVLVSNETSMGIVPMGELTRRFCDEAGLLHQQLADQCDSVVLTVAGLPLYLKQ